MLENMRVTEPYFTGYTWLSDVQRPEQVTSEGVGCQHVSMGCQHEMFGFCQTISTLVNLLNWLIAGTG